MLKSLIISNYALIENLEIDFPEGLIIITGETGAGKSILMGALSLLLGNKADPETLKNPEKNCVVEAIFSNPGDREMRDLLVSEGIDADSDLILRRLITPGGKSRSFINDQPVTLQFLKSISGKIVDIHAQHQHLLLGESRFQLSVLDSYAGNGTLLKKYSEVHRLLIEKETQLGKLIKEVESIEIENEFNAYQLKQLTDATLKEGELEELESEFKILSNAEEIKISLQTISSLIENEEFSVIANLKEASAVAGKISSNFSSANELSARLESCKIELKDILDETESLAESVIISPERASAVEERISDLYKLLKKHHLSNVTELISYRDSLAEKIDNSDMSKEAVEKLKVEVDILHKERTKLADKLHSIREQNIEKFSSTVRSVVRDLEMPYAEFITKLEKGDNYSDTGYSTITFLFSANKNIDARELNKVASGGELSRIMLSLKSILAKGIGMPTMIFDEIDTGVSGRIADKMGSLIMEMAKEMQIFAITHLPQIASKGVCHLLVYKEIEDNIGTKTLIKRIEGDERKKEIARMLSGTKTTTAALANAQELLEN
ncbi:MAG: DNA repair protein RecN [Bacteroidales bacterium]|jgi:DNA repair protein RecN (Recombination protein N)|nr:DNA repair protein RecN [Bacteroidales bacterium]MDD4057824.1 DNA repair protein RecN [Bacteroidales bacterium]